MNQPQVSYVDPEVMSDILGLFLHYEPQSTLGAAIHAAMFGGIPPRPHFEKATPSQGILTLNRGLGWTFVMYDRGDAMDIGPIYRGPARRYIEASIRA